MKMKFLCLNMWQGGNLMDAAIDYILQVDPDILALQEVYDSNVEIWDRKFRTLQVLQKELPSLKYSHFAPAFLESKPFGKMNQGNAVFSKLPILRTSITFGDVPF